MDPFPQPTSGAPLLLSFRMQRKTVLIIGGDALAASRAYASLEADADVVVLVHGGLQALCEELKWRTEQGQLTVLDWTELSSKTFTDELIAPATEVHTKPDVERDIAALDAYLADTHSISLVCVTGTLSTFPSTSLPTSPRNFAPHIARICRSRRIPVNITDMPALCDFFFAATHRFVDQATGKKSSMQLAVTANGEGCRLAGRIRRDAVAALPCEVGGAVVRVGQLRRLAREQEKETGDESGVIWDTDVEIDAEDNSVNSPNRPVPMRRADNTESAIEALRRRMQWVAQVSEYWPIPRLATLSESDMRDLLSGNTGLPPLGHSTQGKASRTQSVLPLETERRSQHGLQLALPISSSAKKGRILLVGSGPGHPSMLTLATHSALTKHADLVLSDKLVPSAVLQLIPEHVELRIARKFPGNADGAQTEMMEAAVEAATRGLTVVRLKQGDPSVYGRAGEEVLYFRSHGFEPLVVPGVSSAIAAPTFAGIPVTQRGVSETFVVCTGVGRQGKEVRLPGYERSRTLLILMGVARLGEVVGALLGYPPLSHGSIGSAGVKEASRSDDRRDGSPYPPNVPIAIIERGSMPDQRVLVSTLADICVALESLGAQRPPGMIVVGWSVLALHGQGDLCVLDEGEGGDEHRIRRWLCGHRWRVLEGIAEGWTEL